MKNRTKKKPLSDAARHQKVLQQMRRDFPSGTENERYAREVLEGLNAFAPCCLDYHVVLLGHRISRTLNDYLADITSVRTAMEHSRDRAASRHAAILPASTSSVN